MKTYERRCRDIEPIRTISWPGAKYRVLDSLLRYCPMESFNAMCEPFLGTGALTLALSDFIDGPVYAAEKNLHIYNWWHWFLKQPTGLLNDTAELRDRFVGSGDDREIFNSLRDGYNERTQGHPTSRLDAAWLWVLIFASTNNLCRFNKKGMYNQTWGKGRVVPDPYDVISQDTLDRLLHIRYNFRIYRDYEDAIQAFVDFLHKGKTGICYMDPPYFLTSGMYDAHSWSRSDLQSLMNYIELLESIGSWWIYTDYLQKGEAVHPFRNALSRFRQVPLQSTRDARPAGAAKTKHEVIILGSTVVERGLEWAYHL
jgi:site-specific DNA-adenine methylase